MSTRSVYPARQRISLNPAQRVGEPDRRHPGGTARTRRGKHGHEEAVGSEMGPRHQ